MKGGVARVYKRNLYPGYVFVEMATEEDGSVPENVWFMVKETTGVGDFIGSDGKPTPMAEHDIAGMLAASDRIVKRFPRCRVLNFQKGDQVKITSGSFENFEGEVDVGRREARHGDRDRRNLRPLDARRSGILAVGPRV
jgi:transcriptional antiterminator NusG